MLKPIFIVFTSMLIVGCTSAAEKQMIAAKQAQDIRLDALTEDGAEWYENPQFDELYFYADGISQLPNARLSVRQARLDAMSQLAETISSEVAAYAKQTGTAQESNIDPTMLAQLDTAASNLSTANLSGTEMTKKKIVRNDAGITTYVRLRISKENAANEAISEIKKLDENIAANHERVLNDLREAIVKKRQN